jgi:acyl carrier protein
MPRVLALYDPAMNMGDVTARIHTIVGEHGRLGQQTLPLSLEDNTDLYQAGMTSHASVNVMLALEGEFSVEFPDQMLTRDVFHSVASIRAALEQLIPA